MNSIISWNVARHFLAQGATLFVLGGLAGLGNWHYADLGVYAPLIQSAVAVITSIVHEYIGSAT